MKTYQKFGNQHQPENWCWFLPAAVLQNMIYFFSGYCLCLSYGGWGTVGGSTLEQSCKSWEETVSVWGNRREDVGDGRTCCHLHFRGRGKFQAILSLLGWSRESGERYELEGSNVFLLKHLNIAVGDSITMFALVTSTSSSRAPWQWILFDVDFVFILLFVFRVLTGVRYPALCSKVPPGRWNNSEILLGRKSSTP